MPDEIAQEPKHLNIKSLLNSSIIRIILILLFVGIYSITLSPLAEQVINESMAKYIREHSTEEVNSLTPMFNINVYAGDYNLSSSLEKSSSISKTQFFTIDPRVVALNKFLSDYHSPMASWAETFILEADKYGLDWRLVASISGVESAFGNIVPSGNSNNAWGWRGINKNAGGWSTFNTWEDGIKEITRGLSEGYGVELSPFEIEPAYCPPCAANPAHAWANGVKRFMEEIDYYLDNLENL